MTARASRTPPARSAGPTTQATRSAEAGERQGTWPTRRSPTFALPRPAARERVARGPRSGAPRGRLSQPGPAGGRCVRAAGGGGQARPPGELPPRRSSRRPRLRAARRGARTLGGWSLGDPPPEPQLFRAILRVTVASAEREPPNVRHGRADRLNADRTDGPLGFQAVVSQAQRLPHGSPAR